MGYKTGQKLFPEATAWAYWPKLSLHRFSLRKSPIKNCWKFYFELGYDSD